ncbi:unnamed protein product [Menidia menidia]|uniref:Hexosyltransferase n=1 Tax=Menidia menidia TaxID=238744 RepID=A0A8S4B921_9TELE|nr:unnamed protein product [Menidia menidia]
MRNVSPRGLLKLLGAAAALLLSAHFLLSAVLKRTAVPNPLPVEDRLISPLAYRYLLNQPEACRDRSPFLVFMVPVAPRDTAARDAVRRTWGAPRRETLTLFYAGLSEAGSPEQEALDRESRLHGDIVQMDFVDSYRNLTIKTMMMMKWLASHCPYATYAMKVDADIFVNVNHLLRRLQSSPRLGFITGSVIRDGRPRRDPASKWYLSAEQYPEARFPPYVSGAGYVFSTDLAGRISWASRFVRSIPLEDVYVGLCLRVLGVRPVYSHAPPFARSLFAVQRLPYDRCAFSRMVIVNGFRPHELLRAWEDFSRGHADC